MSFRETKEIDSRIESAIQLVNTDINRAIKSFEIILEQCKAINYTAGIAIASHEIGACYDKKEVPDKAMEYCRIAMPLFIATGNEEGEARSCLMLAKLFANFGDKSKQAEYTFKGLELAIATKNLRLQQKFYNNLANYYQEFLKDSDKAIEYINIAAEISMQMKDYKMLATNYCNLGISYCNKRDFDTAMKYLQLSEETNTKYANDDLIRSFYLLYIGFVYFERNKEELALQCFNESLEICRKNGFWNGYCENKMMVAQVYERLGKIDEAISTCHEGIETAKKKKIRRVEITIYIVLSDIYEKCGKIEEALANYELYRNTRIEQISVLNEKNLEQLKFLNHLEQAQKESEILKEKNSETFKINELLIETDKEKNDFLGVVVHDLKNPLTNIILIAGSLKKNYEKLSAEKAAGLFEKIYLSAERMLDIIDNLLDINKIESGDITLNITEIKLRELIQKIISEFEIYSSQKNIKIILNSDVDEDSLSSDEMVIKEILMNLISNALKYSHKDSEVKINIGHDEHGKKEIKISDYGLGIKEEEKKKVFQKFAKISNKPTAGENSTGLGLSIVKKLTELCGGEISFESEFGKGSTFTLSF